jgi:hypothetical protein
MDTVRQRTVAPAPGFHAPVDIAVLTERGRAEFARLAHAETLLGWTVQRMNDYVVGTAEPRPAPALEVRP